MGRWLGVLHKVGQLISYWILPASGILISCTTVQRMTNLDKQTDENKAWMTEFEAAIKPKMEMEAPSFIPGHIPNDLTLGTFEHELTVFQTDFNRVIDDPDLPHGADNKPK